jgi:hypothetical protein
MTTEQFDVIEAGARLELNGTDDVINVFQFQKQNITPLSDAETVTQILDILEQIYTIFLAAQSLLLLYRDVRVTNKTQSILLGTVAWPNLVDGENVTDLVPPGAAALINFNTVVSRVSPRKYFGGFTIDSLDNNGTWDDPLLTDLVEVVALMLDSFEVGGHTWQYGYLSPKSLGFEIPVGGTLSDVPAYQRRRKQGRGS